MVVIFNHEWVLGGNVGLLGVATGMILCHQMMRFKGPKVVGTKCPR